MRTALNEVAAVAPEWLQAVAPAAWYGRHGRPAENNRRPKTEAMRQELAALIDAAAQQPELAQSPMVQVLRQVWAA